MNGSKAFSCCYWVVSYGNTVFHTIPRPAGTQKVATNARTQNFVLNYSGVYGPGFGASG